MGKRKDLTGQTFGRLTVTGMAGRDSKNRPLWLCRCECGGTKATIALYLTRGSTRSCGCLGRETQRANGLRSGRAQCHPFSKSSMPREYASWEAMIDRCTRPGAQGFERYGGRGITVCAQWLASFEQFARDMGPRPKGTSLDRIDVDGHYEPSNCRWATRTQQANNRRNNRIVTVDGEPKTLAEWSRITGIGWHTMYGRLKAGWSPGKAIKTPLQS